MLYVGLGFVALTIAALVLGIAGVPGLGPFTNVALLVAIVLLVGGVVTLGHHRYHRHRGAHR